jgi:DNA ligase (NAD+)
VGQNGNITPMIHYDTVEFNGTLHDKSTGSSLARFNELALKEGDYITVKYVNDVMPYVSRLECEHNRNNPNPVIEIIDHCPACRSKLIVSDSGKSLICPNMECPGRSKQRMVNMLQKMNIKGFADASINLINISHLY